MLANHRAHFDGRVKGVPRGDCVDPWKQCFDEFVIDGIGHENTLSADADLARVCIARHRRCGCHTIEVGVRHDNDGGVRTEFHRDLLEPGHLADVLSHVAAAREADFPDTRVTTKGIADLAAGPGHTLDGFIRESGFEKDFNELEGRERGVGGGFDDHRIPGSQGGSDFVAHEVERKVEGCDGRDDAARDPKRESEFARAVG